MMTTMIMVLLLPLLMALLLVMISSWNGPQTQHIQRR